MAKLACIWSGSPYFSSFELEEIKRARKSFSHLAQTTFNSHINYTDGLEEEQSKPPSTKHTDVPGDEESSIARTPATVEDNSASLDGAPVEEVAHKKQD